MFRVILLLLSRCRIFWGFQQTTVPPPWWNLRNWLLWYCLLWVILQRQNLWFLQLRQPPLLPSYSLPRILPKFFFSRALGDSLPQILAAMQSNTMSACASGSGFSVTGNVLSSSTSLGPSVFSSTTSLLAHLQVIPLYLCSFPHTARYEIRP